MRRLPCSFFMRQKISLSPIQRVREDEMSDFKPPSRRRDQMRRLLTGQYAAEKIASSEKLRPMFAKALSGTTYEERWKVILKMDEDTRKKMAKHGLTRLGAGCYKGKCSQCVFEGCIHDCHRGQIWFSPFREDGTFNGFRFMAWITPEQKSNNPKMR